METHELHRGRFYLAAFEALGIPLGGEGPDYFRADELFVSAKDSRVALAAGGKNVEAVFHGRAQRTAESVQIQFS